MNEVVNIAIDDVNLTVDSGEMFMKTVLQADVYIPLICCYPGDFLKTQQKVSDIEGVFQLLDEVKLDEAKVIETIVDMSNLRQSLREKLEDESKARNSGFEKNLIYIQRESQIVQRFPPLYGYLPEGGERRF